MMNDGWGFDCFIPITMMRLAARRRDGESVGREREKEVETGGGREARMRRAEKRLDRSGDGSEVRR